MWLVIIAADVLLMVGAARAETTPSPASSNTQTGNVCLWTYQIDHTTVPDENTIVFHMLGGKTWINKLATRCTGLKFYGFRYDVNGSREICGNLQTIRVLNTGTVCLLGPFTPGNAKPDSDHAPGAEY